MKNFNVILDEYCKNKYTEKMFDNLIYYLCDIKDFCYGKYRDKNYIESVFERTIDIIDKLKECDETSATKCFNTINEIKELMNERL